jgi:hypothetical protein
MIGHVVTITSIESLKGGMKTSRFSRSRFRQPSAAFLDKTHEVGILAGLYDNHRCGLPFSAVALILPARIHNKPIPLISVRALPWVAARRCGQHGPDRTLNGEEKPGFSLALPGGTGALHRRRSQHAAPLFQGQALCPDLAAPLARVPALAEW